MTTALLSAWTSLCHHCDGIAIGTTIETLERAGALDRLRREPMSAPFLAEACGLMSGYVALASKLLRSQGLADIDRGMLRLTEVGLDVLADPSIFRGAQVRIGQAADLLRALVLGNSPGGSQDIDLTSFDRSMAERWRQQALGPLAAAAWFGLDRRGVLRRLGDHSYRAEDSAEREAFRILNRIGWTEEQEDGSVRLTEVGSAAADLVVQYAYPLCYLPTFASVPDLLKTGSRLPRVGGDETHVDRSLDIAFSGAVFAKSCREPFLKLALPLLDADIADQPVAIVDTGSGDGTVLASLFEAIRDRTRRGRMLDRHPIILIGVEVNEVARRSTEERLARLGVASKAILGDIGDPRSIAEALGSIGIDPMQVLHVNKSVIHNRSFRQPKQRYAVPETSAVFVGPDGECIPANALFADLVSFFADWTPFLGPHGMISIEAHTVAPELPAARIGRNLITLLDAAHGYSGQYLVEIDVHRKAQDYAGLTRRAQNDVGSAMVGAPIMSVDHLVRR
ncbi:AprA-related methyltransferase [Microvirga puerhi]|uniref:AprA-like MT2-like domain-containing protein n=1 Tax=Microvirga puerhi TaxID=2876078 RepID=A0ABS7VH54_9HYPH|nr:hypothetical protein [Microvirga puerhi]MBZ6074816.1 hypothetical protein [Microvirga puerhi]